MRRNVASAVALAAIIAAPAVGHADGMPKSPPKHAVHHRVRHSQTVPVSAAPAVAPVHCERPASFVPPASTAYDRIMVDYLRCPSITGYRPGSVPEEIGGVRTNRVVDWSVRAAPQAPRPPEIDAFPYRTQLGATLLQYDNTVGTYVTLSARDTQRAEAAMAAAQVPLAPVPLIR